MRRDFPSDDSLEQALEQWGRSQHLPPTPPIAEAVARQMTTPTPNRTWLPLRWPSRRPPLAASLLAIPVLGAIAVAIVLSSAGSARNASGLSLQAVLARAATTGPQGQWFVRQTFDVRTRVHGKVIYRTLNVWEGYDSGSYTILAITQDPRLSVVRYEEAEGSFRRSWGSSAAGVRVLISRLAGTPVQIPDARAIAAGLAATDRTPSYAIGRFDRKRAYIITVKGQAKASLAFRIYLDAASFHLLGIRAPGYGMRLTMTTIVNRQSTPQLVSTYLRSGAKPTGPPEGVTAY